MRGIKHAEEHGDELRELLRSGYKLEWSRHVEDREDQRHIPPWQAIQAFENGECIHFACTKSGTKWLWLGYAKIAPTVYRPLHLVIATDTKDKVLTVVTVYDPSQSPHLWDETYTIRLCWKPEKE